MEQLPNLRDFNSYQEVLQHLVERHGAEGLRIVKDQDQSPFVWHECAHAGMVELPEGTQWDHTHEGTDAESTKSLIDSIMGMMSNGELLEILKQSSEDSELQEHVEQNEEYLRSLE